MHFYKRLIYVQSIICVSVRGGQVRCSNPTFNPRQEGWLLWLVTMCDLQCLRYRLIQLGDMLLWLRNYTLFQSFSPVFMHQIGTILFFNHFFSLLPNMSTHNLIIGGDINCVLSSLDRSTLRKTPLTKSAQSINLFLEIYGIADVWRFRNPTSRAYSFFSPVHKTYSRIDCFFLNKRILHSIVECDYEAIVVSDHGPLSMKILVPDTQPIYRPWRLNALLLSEEEFVSFI